MPIIYGQCNGFKYRTNNDEPRSDIEHGTIEAWRDEQCMCLRCQDAKKRHKKTKPLVIEETGTSLDDQLLEIQDLISE